MKVSFLASKNFLTFGLGFNTFYVETDKKDNWYYLGNPTHHFMLYIHLLCFQIIILWEV